METKTIARTVLWYEIGAFSLLIVLSWVDELLGIPARLFGGSHHSNIPEAVLETIVIIIVAIPIVIRTRRVVARLFYLEGFLKVCAWCQKVETGGDWVPDRRILSATFRRQDIARHVPRLFWRAG